MHSQELRHLISDTPRVMVVDGSKMVRKMIADVLKRELPGVEVIGCASIADMHAKAEFVEISSAGMRESHVHDVQITKESPNYRME